MSQNLYLYPVMVSKAFSVAYQINVVLISIQGVITICCKLLQLAWKHLGEPILLISAKENSFFMPQSVAIG